MNKPNVLDEGKVLLVGQTHIVHLGAHLLESARTLGLHVSCVDPMEAFAGPLWIRKFNWWFRQHRPPQMRALGLKILGACREFRPRWILATGIAPLETGVLAAIGKLGVLRFNYLTDDPWNPSHRASWFLETLPLYDHIFSPRQANIGELRRLGCSAVSYLPFAYSPAIHFQELPATDDEWKRFGCDLLFVGGADKNRLPWVQTLIKSGFHVALYGGYWDRFRETRKYARGFADPTMLRRATSGAKVSLCLVRRANRDGHSMRSFEIPAMGGCMLTEDTEDHRKIFGKENGAVLYFRTKEELVEKLRWLLQNDDERVRLAQAARVLVTRGKHTYTDRLVVMLGLSRDP